MAENALLKSDESGMLGFMKWTNQKLDEIQKWKSIQSRINSISLLKYNDIAGAVTTEVITIISYKYILGILLYMYLKNNLVRSGSPIFSGPKRIYSNIFGRVLCFMFEICFNIKSYLRKCIWTN